MAAGCMAPVTAPAHLKQIFSLIYINSNVEILHWRNENLKKQISKHMSVAKYLESTNRVQLALHLRNCSHLPDFSILSLKREIYWFS